MSDYHIQESWRDNIPPRVARAKRLYEHFTTLKLGLARDNYGWWEERAAKRLQTGNFRGAQLEAKAFDVYHKLSHSFGKQDRKRRRVLHHQESLRTDNSHTEPQATSGTNGS